MKTFFLEVNESIETHIAEGQNKTKTKQNKQFISLIDNQNLVFVQVQPNEHFGCDMFVSTMFDELAERPLMSPLAGTKHAYVRLAIEIFSR